MSQDELKEQLAEAIRAGDDSAALRIALDLIEQMERIAEDCQEENKRLKIRLSMGRPHYDPTLNHRMLQNKKSEDSE
jgi:hypothetical protein